MRIKITHVTDYSYDEPAKSTIQMLRLTPRGHDGQAVLKWSLDTEADARLIRREDWYGNIMHTAYAHGPIEVVRIKVTGEVETTDTGGIVRGAAERFPDSFYRRETPLTAADPALRAFAEETCARLSNPLDRAHALMGAIHDRMRFDTAVTDAATPAQEAFAAGHGVCQDFTHVFLAAARHLGLPARYVSGYLYRPDLIVQEAGHAWAEALIEDLGWVTFDAANSTSTTEHYIRLAIGLDYLEAAPVRGSYHGASLEKLSVSLRIESARQGQS